MQGVLDQGYALATGLRRILVDYNYNPRLLCTNIERLLCKYGAPPLSLSFIHVGTKDRGIRIMPGERFFPWDPFRVNPESMFGLIIHLLSAYEQHRNNVLLSGILYVLDLIDRPVALVDLYAEERKGRDAVSVSARAHAEHAILMRHCPAGATTFGYWAPDTEQQHLVLLRQADTGEHVIIAHANETTHLWRPLVEPPPQRIVTAWPLRLVDLCMALRLVLRAKET